MNKDDYIWAAIKIFGIYLVVMAITSIPEVISSSMQSYFFYTSDKITESGADAYKIIMAASGALSSLVRSLSKTIIFGVVGIYLIKSGKLIFNLVQYSPDKLRGKNIS
jgi:hypothetical protein